MKRCVSFSLGLALSLFIASCTAHNVLPPSANETHVTPPPPSAEQMEAAFKRASTPTTEHDFLKQFAGTWNATTTMWMPDGTQETTKGISTNSMVLGGRFLRQEFHGTVMGKAFEGIGFTGFDTVMKQFWSTWIDSTSTGMMVSTGSLDPTSKVITQNGSFSCPLINGPMKTRLQITYIDPRHHTFAMYVPGPDGNEMKALEIRYVRKK